MALEDVVERIKLVKQSKRIAVVVAVGIGIPGFHFYEEYNLKVPMVQSARAELSQAENEFNLAKTNLASLPDLEKRLEFTQEQLVLAQRQLPEDFRIEQILELVAESAAQSGVNVTNFAPKEAILDEKTTDFLRKRVNVEIRGDFLQLAAFVDRVAHLETLLHIENMNIEVLAIEEDESSANQEAAPEVAVQSVRSREDQLRDRDLVGVVFSMDLVTYRVANDQDRASAQPEGLLGGNQGQEGGI